MRNIPQFFICLCLVFASQLSCGTTELTRELSYAKTEVQCGDFLDELKKKPNNLIFLGCEKTNDAQLHVFKASYKVLGKDAVEIERYLQKYFQMPKLRFVCCGWEMSPDRGTYKNSKGFDYQIMMRSEETLINNRSDWGKIPFFYIEVILPLEEP